MRMWLVLLFAIGLALFGLGLTDFPLTLDPLLGFVSNKIISIVVGVLLILFVLWRWRARVKKIKLERMPQNQRTWTGGKPLLASREEALRHTIPRHPMNERSIRRESKRIRRKAREAEKIRAAHAMEFKRDPRYEEAA